MLEPFAATGEIGEIEVPCGSQARSGDEPPTRIVPSDKTIDPRNCVPFEPAWKTRSAPWEMNAEKQKTPIAKRQ